MKWIVICYNGPEREVEADDVHVDRGTLSLVGEPNDDSVKKVVALFAPDAWAACIKVSEGESPK